MQTIKNGNIVFRDKLFVGTLNHYLIYPFKCLPHLDPIEDDNRLEHTYINCIGNGKWESLQETPNDFPESVKDRLTYLFGVEISLEYEALMHPFGGLVKSQET